MVKTKVRIEKEVSQETALHRIYDSRLDLPDDCFILECKPLEEILFNRDLVGGPLQTAEFKASRYFFNILRGLFDKYSLDERCEWANLTGSDFYFLGIAHWKEFRGPLFRNYVGFKREVIPGKVDENGKQLFRTTKPYISFEAEAKIAILGETIATGISSCNGARTYLPWAIGHGLEKLVVFSYCATKDGCVRLHKVCRDEFKISLTLVVGLGILDLGKDGTAIMWNAEDGSEPITLPKYHKKGKEIYVHGECSIGDFGGRNRSPKNYFEERAEEKRRLGIV